MWHFNLPMCTPRRRKKHIDLTLVGIGSLLYPDIFKKNWARFYPFWLGYSRKIHPLSGSDIKLVYPCYAATPSKFRSDFWGLGLVHCPASQDTPRSSARSASLKTFLHSSSYYSSRTQRYCWLVRGTWEFFGLTTALFIPWDSDSFFFTSIRQIGLCPEESRHVECFVSRWVGILYWRGCSELFTVDNRYIWQLSVVRVLLHLGRPTAVVLTFNA